MRLAKSPEGEERCRCGHKRSSHRSRIETSCKECACDEFRGTKSYFPRKYNWQNRRR